jgi:tyrosinase
LPNFQKAPVVFDQVPTGLGDLFVSQLSAQVPSWFGDLFSALLRQRMDHRALNAQARKQFNVAIQQAHSDGSYQTLAAVHADMSHRMHSMSGPVGTQRFLPWHRIYLLKMEGLLRSKQPGLTIPYWNYGEDTARPDWVWQPPRVKRNTPGAAGGSLPSKAVVDNLVNNTTRYTNFTYGLEFDAHNQVHNWCNGTISNIPAAAKDPIFWLLHSNVDRIWDLWQLNHTGTPILTGSYARMDPWMETASDANDVIRLGYSYG